MNIDIKDLPLQVIADCFRNELIGITDKYKQLGVPAFISEGIISEALADARKDRAKEVADGYSSILAKIQKEDDKKPEDEISDETPE